ncbi:FxSxx-COOH system tetratricopeptide repeat protein [Spirillospora sp. CA-294931]|uniref:FxSxx-COOH system tetratricopeptide repeat protein n=1 Tax=Spirillospora sp. CA-294931 TaxID=3240042 RepID=UPI003D909DAE
MPVAQPALHRSIVAVDVEGFGDRSRTNPDQLRVRDALYRAMRWSFARAGIPWDRSHHEDRGDGILVLVLPEVPKVRLSADLPHELAVALQGHNEQSPPAARIRLRMVLHAGEIHYDAHGVAGSSINGAFRLLEARGVKEALAGAGGPLAVVVSEWFFEDVVRHDTRSRPDAYSRVQVEVKETSTTALVRVVEPAEAPADVVPVSWNVPRRNPDFTGRGALLDRLAERLGEASGLSPPACVLHGMGGVGKSQLSREFAHRFAARFTGVWWIDASHSFSAARGLAELADRLALPTEDAPHRIRLLWDELARRGRWLLIYDNAENEEDLRAWWPAPGVGGVLVTSRTSTWRLAEPVQVPAFTRAESIAFLRRMTGGRTDEAARVAGELGDLPLALAQAAAYVTRNHASWGSYAEILRDAPARLMHLNSPADYLGTAATTWSVSMTRVEEERPEGADLLRLCAFLDPDRIPRGIVRSGTPGLPPALRRLAEDHVVYDQAIGALAEYALIDATPEALSVHPLVQKMIHESITDPDGWLTAAARLLARCFPDRPRLPATWEECGDLLPHVAAIARHPRAMDAAPAEISEACHRAAAYLEVRDQHEQALELLGHALAFRERAFGPSSREYAETLTSRGEVECYLGHHTAAVTTARAALAVLEDGDDLPASLPTLRLLGRALTETGRPCEAVGVLERAARIGADAFGDADARTAELYARLAYALWRAGDLRSAQETYRDADRVWQAARSAPDRERTVAYRWHAAVLCDLGEHTRARSVAERAIRMARGLYGPDHVETVRAEETFGIVLAASGEPDEGVRLQRRAVRFLRRSYPVPVVVAGALTALARSLLRAGRPAEARAAAEEAHALYVGRHGTMSHVYNAGALAALGAALSRLGKPRQARRRLEEARAIYEEAAGPDHLLADVLAELDALADS